ncbi:hypothetical protein QE152_g32647 [Popillia japonica]|uniref:Uncharacterized protein n=1 Tax=Popillia japonica TaxID=7064 RepID=A0AAW1IYA1_POPJA
MIATNTPEKDTIEERAMASKNRGSIKDRTQQSKVKKSKSNCLKKIRKSAIKEEEPILDSSSDECFDSIDPHGFPELARSPMKPILDSSSDECFDSIDPHGFPELARSPMKYDFVLVEFTGKTEKKIYFVGKVLSKIGSNQKYDITFLSHQKKGTSKFVFPDVADEAVVPKTDIKLIMPPSILCGHTSRQKAPCTFEIDLSLLNLPYTSCFTYVL